MFRAVATDTSAAFLSSSGVGTKGVHYSFEYGRGWGSRVVL